MKFFCLLFFLFVGTVSTSLPSWALSEHENNYIEVDFTKREAHLKGFYLGNEKVEGLFSFDIKKQESLISGSRGHVFVCTIEGQNVLLGTKTLPWLKAKLIKRGSIIEIAYLYFPEFMVKGEINLSKGHIVLNMEGGWQQNSPILEGLTHLKARIWGKLRNPLVSGTVTIEEGRYNGMEFRRLALNFLGKHPLLNITDSKVTLRDGNTYEMVGEIDLRNFENLIAGADFVSQKVSFGGWEILSEEDKAAGLKKNVDEKFDILFDTYSQEDEFSIERESYSNGLDTGAEVRYKVEKGQFIRLRMQEDRTIVGFEKRKEF
ncbi:MAG: hypothetical protein JSW40_06830 [Candidatus Omnitrophota bacterium]|nr:MAG: hypothetical protein JSW40_06830 [Candidatus Omnitrophota bacterium]